MRTPREERELVVRIFGEVSDDGLTAAHERFQRAQRSAADARQRSADADIEVVTAWADLVASCEQTDRALTLLHTTAAMAEGQQ
jgi:RecA/RadA recombinase